MVVQLDESTAVRLVHRKAFRVVDGTGPDNQLGQPEPGETQLSFPFAGTQGQQVFPFRFHLPGTTQVRGRIERQHEPLKREQFFVDLHKRICGAGL